MTNRRKKTEAAAPESPSFEEVLARLEEIVADLEEGGIGLGPSLSHYEEGVKYLRQGYQLLEHAERKIEILLQVDPQGEAVTESFTDPSQPESDATVGKGKEGTQRKVGRRSTTRRATKPKRDDLSPNDDIDEAGQLF